MKKNRIILLALFVFYSSLILAQAFSMESFGKRVYDGTDWKSNSKFYQTTSILNLREKQKVWDIYTSGKKTTYTIQETIWYQYGKTINIGKVCSYVCFGENGVKYNISLSYMSDITGYELFILTVTSPQQMVDYHIYGDEFWKNTK